MQTIHFIHFTKSTHTTYLLQGRINYNSYLNVLSPFCICCFFKTIFLVYVFDYVVVKKKVLIKKGIYIEITKTNGCFFVCILFNDSKTHIEYPLVYIDDSSWKIEFYWIFHLKEKGNKSY